VLRVTLEIVPHGDEERAQVIEVLEIANIGLEHDYGFGHKVCNYASRVIDLDDEEEVPAFDRDTPVLHDRRDGPWRLVQRVLDKMHGKALEKSQVVHFE